MESKKITLLIYILSICLPSLFSQENPDPVFDYFYGEAFKIPARYKMPGYHEKIRNLEKAGEIKLKEIRVPESDYKKPFPGLEFMHRFAIIFNSKMAVAKKAIYVFSLNSDDGSRLWIDGREIIENDQTHKMRFKSDTVLLEKGNYPIKLWYFQGFPDRYGIEFNAHFYKEYDPGTDGKYVPFSAVPKLVFNNTNLPFASNSYYLEEKGMSVMDSLAAQLNQSKIKRITINGHTDNVGTEIYNQQLSVKRANTIKSELIKRLDNNYIGFEINGFGESDPVTTNENENGRSKNRRVEIIIE